MTSARRVALGLLREWEKGNSFAADLIERGVRRGKLEPKDRGFVQQLLYSVLRNRTLLDYFAATFADGKLDPRTARVLQFGLAEAFLLGSAPHALVNETVSLAPAWSRRIVNAILRRATDETVKQASLAEIETLPPEVRWSTPLWLWKRWVGQFGEADAEALCRWNNLPAPVYIRLNPLNPPPGESENLDPSQFDGYQKVVGDLPKDWLASGQAYAQDPSTAHAIQLLDAQPGQTVLDACAAPGGKTFAIACAMKNEGRIIAADRDSERVERMRGNLDRLGVSIADPQVIDWLEPLPDSLAGTKFDRILVDAPCSNTGVMRRRIDVRWRIKPAEFDRLRKTQLQLLSALTPLLAPGGRLVYSTCSIDEEENSQLVGEFAEGLSEEFKLVDSAAIFPWKDGCDGAFAAAIDRG
ncbi:MAG: 16S rRNA (cytosine967-C5)-methyltransferase [Verrucomicrobiales bacterium]|jgi:16S rRNA (cytosine967-C5)-methyltransferase